MDAHIWVSFEKQKYPALLRVRGDSMSEIEWSSTKTREWVPNSMVEPMFDFQGRRSQRRTRFQGSTPPGDIHSPNRSGKRSKPDSSRLGDKFDGEGLRKLTNRAQASSTATNKKDQLKTVEDILKSAEEDPKDPVHSADAVVIPSPEVPKEHPSLPEAKISICRAINEMPSDQTLEHENLTLVPEIDHAIQQLGALKDQAKSAMTSQGGPVVALPVEDRHSLPPTDRQPTEVQNSDSPMDQDGHPLDYQAHDLVTNPPEAHRHKDQSEATSTLPTENWTLQQGRANGGHEQHSQDISSHARVSAQGTEEHQKIMLEEQVSLIESSLTFLRNRRQEITNDLESANSTQQKAVSRIMHLQRRRLHLRKRRTQQGKLTESIRSSLAQTAARLRRLDDCTTVEEMQKLADIESIQAQERQMALDQAGSDGSDMEVDDDLLTTYELPCLETLINWPSTDPLWRHSGPYLLMGLASKDHIARVMDIINSEVGDDTRREYLHNTCLDMSVLLRKDVPLSVPNSGTNKGQAPKTIEAFVPLCPYEMDGVCADPECSYQHLEKRPLGSVLPKELLSLPDLRLGRSSLKSVAIGGENQKPSSSSGENTTPALGHIDNNTATAAGDDILDNDDFVAMGDFEETNESVQDVPKSPLYWWMDDVTVLGLSRPSCFERHGVMFQRKAGQVIRIKRQESELHFQAMVVDGCAFALHAGRSDIFETLRCSVDGTLSDILQDVENSALDLNATKNIFKRAFNSQLAMTAVALVIETLYELSLPLTDNTIPSNFLSELQSSEITPSKAPPTSAFNMELKAPNTVVDLIEQLAVDHMECKVAAHGASDGSWFNENILHESLQKVRKLIQRSTGRSSKLAAFKSINFFSRITFDLLEQQASLFNGEDSHFDENALRKLCTAIDKALRVVCEISKALSSSELLLAPLMAANVSFAVALRRYDKAHQILSSHLDDNAHAQSPENALSYSELLWSQLIQLRSTFPNRDVDPTRRTNGTKRRTKEKNQASNNALASFVSERNVFPRHVHLHADEKIDKDYLVCRTYLHRVQEFAMARSQLGHREWSISLQGLSLEATAAPPRTTAIPHSLFFIGPQLSELNLSSMKLLALSERFGEYFPNLKVLDLSSNFITKLPESLDELEKLEDLNISNNKLESLPEMLKLPLLKSLDAHTNRISRLPESLRLCLKLESLDMDGNPLVLALFWQLVSQLPMLRDLKPQKSKVNDK